MKKNKKFREDALETTLDVIEGKTKEGVNLRSASKEAVNYLLKELAFVLASTKIYNVERITYVYHYNWPIFQKLISGQYDNVKREKVGFLLFK